MRKAEKEGRKKNRPAGKKEMIGVVEDELIEEFGYPNQKFVLHPKE